MRLDNEEHAELAGNLDDGYDEIMCHESIQRDSMIYR